MSSTSERCVHAELPCEETKSVISIPVYPETLVLVQKSTGRVWIRGDCLSGDNSDNWVCLSEKANHALTFF